MMMTRSSFTHFDAQFTELGALRRMILMIAAATSSFAYTPTRSIPANNACAHLQIDGCRRQLPPALPDAGLRD